MKNISKFLLILFAVATFANTQAQYFLASGSGDKTIRIWDTKTWKLKETLEGHTITVDSVAFSPWMQPEKAKYDKQKKEHKTKDFLNRLDFLVTII